MRYPGISTVAMRMCSCYVFFHFFLIRCLSLFRLRRGTRIIFEDVANFSTKKLIRSKSDILASTAQYT